MGTSQPQINILHEFINKSYKVIFPLLDIRKYTKLYTYEPTTLQESPIVGPNEF